MHLRQLKMQPMFLLNFQFWWPKEKLMIYQVPWEVTWPDNLGIRLCQKSCYFNFFVTSFFWKVSNKLNIRYKGDNLYSVLIIMAIQKHSVGSFGFWWVAFFFSGSKSISLNSLFYMHTPPFDNSLMDYSLAF